MSDSEERMLVLGAGGHGKVVGDLVRACGHELVGYVDLYAERVGEVAEPGGAKVVMAQDVLLEGLAEGDGLPFEADGLVIAVGDNQNRYNLCERIGAEHLRTLVHPSAVVSPSAEIGAGSVVFPTAVINPDVTIGHGAIINTGAVIEHDCLLGDGVHVSPQAVVSGVCEIGDRTWIGAGASIIHEIVIGSDVTVGAGAAVIRDVPSDVTAVGNPARVVD